MTDNTVVSDLKKIVHSQHESAADRIAAANVLISIARDVAQQQNAPLEGETLEVRQWFDASITELTWFFLKCVLAAVPASLVGIFFYITLIVVSSVLPQLLLGAMQ